MCDYYECWLCGQERIAYRGSFEAVNKRDEFWLCDYCDLIKYVDCRHHIILGGAREGQSIFPRKHNDSNWLIGGIKTGLSISCIVVLLGLFIFAIIWLYENKYPLDTHCFCIDGSVITTHSQGYKGFDNFNCSTFCKMNGTKYAGMDMRQMRVGEKK